MHKFWNAHSGYRENTTAPRRRGVMKPYAVSYASKRKLSRPGFSMASLAARQELQSKDALHAGDFSSGNIVGVILTAVAGGDPWITGSGFDQIRGRDVFINSMQVKMAFNHVRDGNAVSQRNPAPPVIEWFIVRDRFTGTSIPAFAEVRDALSPHIPSIPNLDHINRFDVLASGRFSPKVIRVTEPNIPIQTSPLSDTYEFQFFTLDSVPMKDVYMKNPGVCRLKQGATGSTAYDDLEVGGIVLWMRVMSDQSRPWTNNADEYLKYDVVCRTNYYS
jgi:hypothetical protein